MIAKSAVRNFLNEERDSFNWIKKLPLSELQGELKELPMEMDFKTNPRKAQLACFLLGTAFEGWNFHLDMGVGKAQPLDRKIMTPSGFKRMEFIEVGDVISHPNGGTTTVEAIHPQGVIPAYDVEFTDGTTTQCCDDHLWYVMDENVESDYRVRDLKSIRGKEPRKAGLENYSIPMAGTLQLKPFPFPDIINNKDLSNYIGATLDDIEFLEDMQVGTDRHSIDLLTAYFKQDVHPEFVKRFPKIRQLDAYAPFQFDAYSMGCLLGCGDFRQGVPWLNTNDTSIVSHFAERFKDEYLMIEHRDNAHLMHFLGEGYNPATQFLKHLGLYGAKDRRIKIPTCYKFASVEDRINLARGLIDTCADISKTGTIDFGSYSQDLRDDLSFVLQTLGCVTRCEEWKKGRDVWYYLIVFPPADLLLCKTPKKKDFVTNLSKRDLKRCLKSITYIGMKPSQCITVSAEDGLYLTDEMIVTHNTKLTLDLFTWYKTLGKVKRGLVVVPNTGNVEGWAEEVGIHSNLSMSGLIGTPKQRFKALNESTDLCVINYHGLMTMMTNLKLKNPNDTTAGRSRQADRKMVHEFVSQFDFVAFDEIHKAKNKDSLLTYLCDLVASNCAYRYGLTGTPMKTPEDLWSQFYLIDRGETLSADFELFHAAFFRKEQSYGGSEWVFNKRMRRQLTRMIQHRSIRYRDYECQDLPKTKVIKTPLVLPKKSREQYNTAMKGMIEADGNRQKVKNSYQKLREITSGYISIVDEETGEKIFVDFPENPKLEMIKELVDAMPHDSKMIIFHEYIHTGELISQALKEEKINHRCLNGRTKDKPKVIREFKTDETIHVLVASETGTTGHNFQVANYTVFYETFSSPITRRQADKRTHRGGQKKPCFFYDLCVKSSVDGRILDNLQQGIDLSTAILEGNTGQGFIY